MLLKEYQFSIADENGWSEEPPLLLIGDKSFSAIGAIDAAIRWWEKELTAIENEAGDARRLIALNSLSPVPDVAGFKR